MGEGLLVMEPDSILAHVIGVEDLVVVRNLETAFEEETKTCSACRGYASKADVDGFPGIASLFRATARAEQIHAENHARVLRHMRGSTNIPAPNPEIESTFENLRSALVDQRFEVDYLYPAFLTKAVSLFDSTAIRTFHWALEADKSHVRLYADVISRVSWDGKPGWAQQEHSFFVCALCGYTAINPESENCPSCNLLWERFEAIH